MKRTIALGTACFMLLVTGISAAAQLYVSDAWSRPAFDTGVVYVTVTNESPRVDEIVGVKSPLARHVELHESMSTAGPMGSMESMHRLRFIPIPAHGRVVLRPGGYHIMLIGLRKNLRSGMTFPLELDFKRAGWTMTRVTVRAME